MTDSSLSDAPTRSDGEIVQALQDTVRDVYKEGNLEELTVKRIRKAVEVALGLQDGFFANNKTWKDKSKRIVVSEVVRTPFCASLVYVTMSYKLAGDSR